VFGMHVYRGGGLHGIVAVFCQAGHRGDDGNDDAAEESTLFVGLFGGMGGSGDLSLVPWIKIGIRSIGLETPSTMRRCW
jgi:hypothetical protein